MPEGTPALLTRMVTGPSAASAASKARTTEARSVTSSATAAASAPAARSSASSCCRRSSLRAAMATLAPAAASTRAKCWPSPDDAPVTSADLPASENPWCGIGPFCVMNGTQALLLPLDLQVRARRRATAQSGRSPPLLTCGGRDSSRRRGGTGACAIRPAHRRGRRRCARSSAGASLRRSPASWRWRDPRRRRSGARRS